MDLLKWIENWYSNQCDGDWEHGDGIKISTLDNPGWAIDIDIIDTMVETKSFLKLKEERTEEDWFHCWVEAGFFKARGGSRNLEDILIVFKNWVEKERAQGDGKDKGDVGKDK